MKLVDYIGRPTRSLRVAPSSPFLAPNKILGLDKEAPYSLIDYPTLISEKLNGVRGFTLGHEFYSRNLKPLRMSNQIKERFEEIALWAHTHKFVFDGEFHSYSYPTVGETMSILAGTKPMPEDFFFKCFFCLPWDVWNGFIQEPAINWTFHKGNLLELPSPYMKLVMQTPISIQQEFFDIIEAIRNTNKEGLMSLDPRSYYKHNRATLNERTLLKFKFYSDPIDAIICNLTSRRERLPDVEMKIHPLTGKAEQIYTQDDFMETDIAGVMLCRTDAGELVNVPFPVGTNLEERRLYYNSFGKGGDYDLKGQWVCFRKLSCEDRDKPISIKDVQFRDPK